MKLLRLAVMYFDPPPEGWNTWSIEVGGVTLCTVPVGEGPLVDGRLRLLVSAETPMEFPDIDEEGLIHVPEGQRKQCEQGLQIVADLIAVFGRCRRTILSPTPCAVLFVENSSERERLDATKGIPSSRRMISGLRFPIPRSDPLVSGLQDRLSGVALLAEAFSHTRDAGRYREFVRLFEAAFASPFDQLDKKLCQFLNPVFGYSRQEISDWVKFRDPITHADGRKSDLIALDVDVRRVTQRMEQAALDVLFNKAEWHKMSRTRRNLWMPIAFTTSKGGGGIIRQGSELSVQFQVFDDFQVFPVDLNVTVTNPPGSWWFRFHSEESEDQPNNPIEPTT